MLKVAHKASTPLPQVFHMPVLRNAHLPTHVFAVVEADADPSVPPLIVPIDAAFYVHGFRVDLLPQAPQGTAPPVPQFTPQSQSQVVTLPVVPISVPHVASIPLLLLFGLGLETQTNLLAWRLLPPHVIEEFPNAAAMAQVMARLGDEQLRRHIIYNHGLWKNVLALGIKDTRIVELVQTAWNVTAEARRLRQRGGQR